jgi:tyrosine-specific transport protein
MEDREQAEATLRACVAQGLANAVVLCDGPRTARQMRDHAVALKALCRSLDLKFLVDGRVGLAAAVGADGIKLDFDVDLNTTRGYLDACCEAADWGDAGDVYEVGGGVLQRCETAVGRSVRSEGDALLADVEMADYVVVEGDMKLGFDDDFVGDVVVGGGGGVEGEGDGPAAGGADGGGDAAAPAAEGGGGEEEELTQEEEERLARTMLRDLRRMVSSLLIVSHEFCVRAGGPKRVLMAGADGLVIPAAMVSALMEQSEARGPPQSLPGGDRLLGAVMLIAGGTVGAGIIALPVKTFAAGFVPTTLALTAVWAFMTTTALMLVELSLWFGPNTNLTTIAEETLGRRGKVLVTVLYVFIYLATLTAYIAESGTFLSMIFRAVGLHFVPAPLLSLLFTVGAGTLLCLGTEATDKANQACLAVAACAYALLLALGSQSVQLQLLAQGSFVKLIPTLPLMAVAFTFHNMVPSLLSYLGTARRVAMAIVLGSLAPLVMYVLWEGVILGSLPRNIVISSTAEVVQSLQMGAFGGAVGAAVQIFSFFAIVTSFLGVGLGTVDFLSDLFFGSKGEPSRFRVSEQRALSLASITLPALAIGMLCPGIFLAALDYSGTLRLILFGIIPAIMLWRGRYQRNLVQWMPGGKPLLVFVLLVSVSIIGLETCNKFGLLDALIARG